MGLLYSDGFDLYGDEKYRGNGIDMAETKDITDIRVNGLKIEDLKSRWKDLKFTEWTYNIPDMDNVTIKAHDHLTSTLELPALDNLEKADIFVKNLTDIEQAYLYKALYINDVRIDKAERTINESKKS